MARPEEVNQECRGIQSWKADVDSQMLVHLILDWTLYTYTTDQKQNVIILENLQKYAL